MTAPDAAAPLVAPAGSVRIDPAPAGPGVRVAVVAAEYHTDIVQPLVDGAVEECIARGVAPADIALVPVPEPTAGSQVPSVVVTVSPTLAVPLATGASVLTA